MTLVHSGAQRNETSGYSDNTWYLREKGSSLRNRELKPQAHYILVNVPIIVFHMCTLGLFLP